MHGWISCAGSQSRKSELAFFPAVILQAAGSDSKGKGGKGGKGGKPTWHDPAWQQPTWERKGGKGGKGDKSGKSGKSGKDQKGQRPMRDWANWHEEPPAKRLRGDERPQTPDKKR